MNNFEEYLEDKHAKTYMGTDDDMSDSFDSYLQNLDIDDWLRLGTLYGVDKNMEGFNEAISRISK